MARLYRQGATGQKQFKKVLQESAKLLEKEYEMKETKSKTAFLSIVLILIAYGAIFFAAAGYGRGGGSVNAFSHTSTIEIQSDSVGNVVTVTGNRNTVQRPYETYEPESEQHKAGEWVGLLFWVALFVGIVGYLYIKANDYDLLWSKS